MHAATIERAFVLITTLAIIARWLACAAHMPTIGIVAGSFAHAVPPLLELTVVIATVLALVGALVHVQLGVRLEPWSTFGRVTRRMLREFTVDAFGSLRGDYWGTAQEMTMLETVTAYLVSWGSVLFLYFTLFNCAVVLVFMAYATLKEVYARQKALDQERLANARVRPLVHCNAMHKVKWHVSSMIIQQQHCDNMPDAHGNPQRAHCVTLRTLANLTPALTP